MTQINLEERSEALHLASSVQREKFRVEIRKNKIEKSLNGKRFQNISIDILKEFKTLSDENKDLPCLEVDFNIY